MHWLLYIQIPNHCLFSDSPKVWIHIFKHFLGSIFSCVELELLLPSTHFSQNSSLLIWFDPNNPFLFNSRSPYSLTCPSLRCHSVVVSWFTALAPPVIVFPSNTYIPLILFPLSTVLDPTEIFILPSFAEILHPFYQIHQFKVGFSLTLAHI